MSPPVVSTIDVRHPIGRCPATLFLPAAIFSNAYKVLAATQEDLFPPAGASFAQFSAEADFFATFSWSATPTAPVIPVADVTDGTAPFLNPVRVALTGVQSISLISATNQIIAITYYSGGTPSPGAP